MRASRALLLLLALAGCSFQQDVGDDWIMTLPGDETQAAAVETPVPSAVTALKVTLPDAPGWLDSRRVAVRRPDGALDYYAGARWADMLTLQLQQALVANLDSDGHFSQVVADDVAAPTQYRLNVRIASFEVMHDKGQPPTATVRVDYTLQRDLQDVLAGSAGGESALAGETRADIQEGFAAAYRAMVADMVGRIDAVRLKPSAKPAN